jgi:hypothetical protein
VAVPLYRDTTSEGEGRSIGMREKPVPRCAQAFQGLAVERLALHG